MGVVRASMAMTGDGMVTKPADAERAVASGAASSVGYEIDREQLPEAIADLRKALMALEEGEREAMQHETITPPGGDPYSQQAVKAMGPKLVNNYMASNQRDKANIEAMIENLEAAMRRYDADDDEAARRFRAEV
ncbi:MULTISPECIES: hypothetical protein [unclassified Actinopolyspora]|uniref:hypothetical protein n=1 Tax=unclassified Actinopolyspora TaxID=2639451 RepID=UPI0013F5AA97|nr:MULTISPECIES: hypothetical protein [unclassified Actinopolyspora]NHD17809.1 hypothetical protein [Actinopolyspora sp. BKK2]NHE77682.1 hypothetical protein [Actinopolyspora sp. BKK1]